MNKKAKLSVVIPCFNEEKYLQACLKSLEKQEYKDFEIIVVDNNSTDKTTQIAKSFGTAVVEEKKQGITYARNRGFNTASGEIIARIDADSKAYPNWTKTIIETFANNPKACAITGGLSFPEEKRVVEYFLHFFTLYIFHLFSYIFMGHFPLVGVNCAIKKNVWKKIKNEAFKSDKTVHEDIDISCRLQKYGKILYRKELKTSYSMRRWKKDFFYTFFEYTTRYFRSVFIHHPWFKRHKKITS